MSFMLGVANKPFMLSVIMLNVVMQSVVAPAIAHAEGLSNRKKIAQD